MTALHAIIEKCSRSISAAILPERKRKTVNSRPVKILLCGKPGSGKSTVIRRVIGDKRPIYGFETVFLKDGNLYLKKAFDDHAVFSEENRVGTRGVKPGSAVGFPEVFDRAGTDILKNIPEGSDVVLDEMGFLEKDAIMFLNSLTEILKGNYRVIGAIKPLDIPHLNFFRELPGICLLSLTAENREDVFRQAEKLWLGSV